MKLLMQDSSYRTRIQNELSLALLRKANSSASFRRDIENIRMDGPAGKVNFVLSEEPQVNGMPADRSKSQRSLFTLIPTLQEAEDNYNACKRGDIPQRLWVDCVLASNVDDTLAPEGRHMLTCFVQYLPYNLRHGSWDEQRENLGDRVTDLIGQFAPNVPGFSNRKARDPCATRSRSAVWNY